MENLVFFILLQLSTVVISSFIFGRGVVLPSDPYVFINKELTLTCNLTTYEPGEDSTGLYFTRKNNELIPKKYLHIKSTRSIQLKMPVRSAEDGGNYICKLNKTGLPAVIGNQIVVVDHEVTPVKDIECRVYNWENMTCSWDLGQEYVHPDHLSVSLAWTINGPQYDCPHQTLTSCSWWADDGADTFKDNMWYIMRIIVTNKEKDKTTASEIFKINTRNIVKPAVIDGLVSSKNSTCVTLNWSHPKKFHDITYKVKMLSQWEESRQWQEIYSGGLQSYTQCNLTPHTSYLVQVACKPTLAGYWSDYITVAIQTDESVPGAEPPILPGSYVEQPCVENNCRKDRIYWKPLPEKYCHGDITSYTITVEDPRSGRKGENFYFTGKVNSGELKLKRSRTYILQIAASTRKGMSPYFSSLILPATTEKPPGPEDFIVEASHQSERTLLTLRWKKHHHSWPNNNWKKVMGYTVYWCRGSHLSLICEEPIQWRRLEPKKHNFTMELQDVMFDKYLFGISLEMESSSGQVVSSGLKWHDCIYKKNMRPQNPPKNFHLSNFQPDHCLSLEWGSLQCYEKIGHIQSYLLRYCPAHNGGNCTGSISEMRVSGKATRALIRNLEVGKVFKVWIMAESTTGPGPSSSPVYSTVVDRSLKSDEIAGLAVGIILILIICLFGLFAGFRRLLRLLKRCDTPPFMNILPPELPNIPLPARQMTPQSESEDSIYAEIGNPNGPPTPTSPDSFSLNIPLINSTSTFSKKCSEVHPHQTGSDSGRCSMVSTVETLPARLHFTPNYSEGNRIRMEGHNTFSCSDVTPYSCVNIVHEPRDPIDDRNHQSQTSSDSSNSGTASTSSSSSYSPSKIYAFAAKIRALIYKDNLENSPQCVQNNFHGDVRNYVHRPIVRNITGCEDESLNNLSSNSVIDNSKFIVTEVDSDQVLVPTDSQSFNDKIRNDLLFKGDSSVPESHSGMSYCMFGTDQPADEVYNDSNNCKRDGYVTENIFNANDSHPDAEQSEPTTMPDQSKHNTVKGLAVGLKPGPRPISSVVNVPPHFYGSLSLLDDTNSTEL
ncbi:hypothetical protein ScPMuIL_005394 [Solemya velum]